MCAVSAHVPLKKWGSSEVPESSGKLPTELLWFKSCEAIWEWIPFFRFSLNHRRKALCSLPHLRVSFRHLRNASRGELSGRSETAVAAFRWFWFVLCITMVSAVKNQLCQALFVLCRGSAFNKSTYFPNGGTNSCLDLFWAMNLVTSFLCFPLGFRSFVLNFTTFSAMDSLLV